jgi:hypothetical protein
LGQFVVVAAAAALILFPASALAKKKHKKPKGLGPVVTVTAAGNTANAAGQLSTATATCPAGTQALGGGFSLPVGPTAFLSIRESFRSTPSAWKVSAVDIAGSAAVTAYANCRNTALQVTDSTGAGTIPGGTFAAGTATAVCPSGGKLVGGGFQTLSGPDPTDWALAEENLSAGAGAWTARAVNNSGVQNVITAHAYCMSGIKTPTLVSATNSVGAGLYGSSSSTTPACPKPKKSKKGKKSKKPRQLLAAGGFSVTPAGPASVTPFVTDSRLGSGGWLAAAVNANASAGPLSVTSQGVCA